MPSFASVVRKMQGVGRVSTMKFESRSSKGVDDLENPIDMLLKVECRKARELAHYYFDPSNYVQRLAAMRVIQNMITVDDKAAMDCKTDICIALQVVAIAEVVASKLVGQAHNAAIVTEHKLLSDVEMRVNAMLTKALSDMMRDE